MDEKTRADQREYLAEAIAQLRAEASRQHDPDEAHAREQLADDLAKEAARLLDSDPTHDAEWVRAELEHAKRIAGER